MCDCGNSLSLSCLCRMNVYIDPGANQINANTYASQPLAVPPRILHRRNYRLLPAAQSTGFVKRWTHPKWFVDIVAAGFAAPLYYMISEGPWLYLIGLPSGGGTNMRVAKINVLDETIVWATTLSNVNFGIPSVGPYGIDLLSQNQRLGSSPAKTRVNQAGLQTLPMTPAVTTGSNYFTGSPWTGTLPAGYWGRSYGSLARQPAYNFGNTCSNGQMCYVGADNGMPGSGVTDRYRWIVKVGTLPTNGLIQPPTTVWDRTLTLTTQSFFRPGGAARPDPVSTQAGKFNGEIYYVSAAAFSFLGSSTTEGPVAEVVKSHTPWGDFEYTRSNYLYPTSGIVEEVYPDGLLMAFPTGVHPDDPNKQVGKLGYIDARGNNWLVDVPEQFQSWDGLDGLIEWTNHDENGIWLTSRGGGTFGDWHDYFPHIFPVGTVVSTNWSTFVRISKDGQSGEYIAGVGSIGGGGAKDEMPFGMIHPRIPNPAFEIIKRADCMAAGVPDQYPL